MNDMDGLSGGALLGKIVALLPIMLIGLILMGNILFAAAVIFPQWRIHESLTAEIRSGQAALESQAAAQNPDERQVILQSQVNTAWDQLGETANAFLTPGQADLLIQQLYQYAQDSQVEITALRSQTPTQPEADQPVYEIRQYRLQVTGAAPNLLDFLVRIREAAVPSVVVNNLALTQAANEHTLMLDLLMYTSPLAGGQVFANLPDSPAIVTTTFTTPEAAAAIPTDTTLIGATTPVFVAAQPTPAVIVTAAAALPPDVPPDTVCSGAPDSLFQIGDTVVVDFNEIGALRIMARVDSPYIETRAQAYDNQRLTILAGPVCGKYNEENVWYWYVQREGFGDFQGWAAEASPEDRWMCPLANPECS